MFFAKNKALIIEKQPRSYPVRGFIEILEDKNNEYSIHDIIKKDCLFVRSNKLNMGFTTSAYWYKLSITNPTHVTQSLILSIMYPDLNELDFYETSNQCILRSIQTGESRPFNNRILIHRNYLFPIDFLPKSSLTFYIKAYNNGDSVNLPLKLSEQATFFIEDQLQTTINWLFYGVYLAVILLSLFLFIISKRKLYLDYFLYAFFFSLFILNLDGFSRQLLWPNYPWWSNHSTVLFASLGNLFLLSLTKRFLIFKSLEKLRASHRIIYLFQILCFIASILSLFNQEFLLISIYLLNLFYPSTVILIIILSIKSIQQGNALAYYFLIGFSLFFICIVLFQLSDTGIIQSSFLNSSSIFRIGLISEGICLTLAAIDQYRKEIEKVTHTLRIQNQALTIAQNQAENANRLKGVFLSNMSHEIRSPLHIINGYIQLFLQGKIAETDKVNIFHLIKKNAKILLQLIDDIIDISKIEANQLQLNLKFFDLSVFFSEIYEEFKNTKQTVVLSIAIQKYDPFEYFFYTDQLRLKQIISNLINNAYKYTDKGEIIVGYTHQDNQLTFFVKDTGKGIPNNKIDQIFDRFNKLDQSEGTGIGLAISKELVILLNGKIWVESTPNQGTSFYFNLPINFPQKEKVCIQPSNHQNLKHNLPYNWKGKTILIAEDKDESYWLLKQHLEDTEVNLIWAKNGVEAVNLYCSYDNIDLILMDINMPIMNGFEALKAIRQVNPDVPVFSQTAYGLNDEIEKCKNAGFNEYIPKPIDLQTISNTINKYLKL
ncbi:MAG: ATP-binding protein [Flavobacteriales bacterium]|jgi:signal transduction histidine kinase/CheY-like chemotaxis protein|nr:ATP-binding protein [Flavobacteriales bacterium]